VLAARGVPKCFRSDNGPEFIAHAIRTWLVRVGVATLFLPSSTPANYRRDVALFGA
jgi:putative transposase